MESSFDFKLAKKRFFARKDIQHLAFFVRVACEITFFNTVNIFRSQTSGEVSSMARGSWKERSLKGQQIQCPPDLTNLVLTNHTGLTNQFFTSNIFLLHKNFRFCEFPGLTNNWLDPKQFVKSGRHCSFLLLRQVSCCAPWLNGPRLNGYPA